MCVLVVLLGLDLDLYHLLPTNDPPVRQSYFTLVISVCSFSPVYFRLIVFWAGKVYIWNATTQYLWDDSDLSMCFLRSLFSFFFFFFFVDMWHSSLMLSLIFRVLWKISTIIFLQSTRIEGREQQWNERKRNAEEKDESNWDQIWQISWNGFLFFIERKNLGQVWQITLLAILSKIWLQMFSTLTSLIVVISLFW